MKTKYFDDEIINTALDINEDNSKNNKNSQKILSQLIRKDKKVSFSVLSKKFNKDYEELKDILALLEDKLNFKIIYPVIGAPYITIK